MQLARQSCLDSESEIETMGCIHFRSTKLALLSVNLTGVKTPILAAAILTGRGSSNQNETKEQR